MFCPKCKSEYRDGFTVCSNCKTELVHKISPASEVRKGNIRLIFNNIIDGFKPLFPTLKFVLRLIPIELLFFILIYILNNTVNILMDLGSITIWVYMGSLILLPLCLLIKNFISSIKSKRYLFLPAFLFIELTTLALFVICTICINTIDPRILGGYSHIQEFNGVMAAIYLLFFSLLFTLVISVIIQLILLCLFLLGRKKVL